MSLDWKDTVSGTTGVAITAHTPDSGGSYALISGVAQEIASNNYVVGNGGGIVKYSVPASGTGVDLQFSYIYPGGVVGSSNNLAVAWYLDAGGSNYIQAILQEGTLILATVISGAYSPVGSPFSLTVDSAEHRFNVTSRVVSTYPVVTFWIDGTSVLTHTFSVTDLPANIGTFTGNFYGINNFGTTSTTSGENGRKFAAQTNSATANGSDIFAAGSPTLTVSPTSGSAVDASTTFSTTPTLANSSAGLTSAVTGGGTISGSGSATSGTPIVYTPPTSGTGTATITVTDTTDTLAATCTVSYAPAVNATGYTLAASPGSVLTGVPSTITATITGGTTLSAPLVITLVDSLASTISGTITITGPATTGTATINPSVTGSHAITATHTGGGFSGGNGSTTFTATGYDVWGVDLTVYSPGTAGYLLYVLSQLAAATLPAGHAPGTSGGLPTVDGSNGVKLSVGTGTGQISLATGQVTVGINNDKTGMALTVGNINAIVTAIMTLDLSTAGFSGNEFGAIVANFPLMAQSGDTTHIVLNAADPRYGLNNVGMIISGAAISGGPVANIDQQAIVTASNTSTGEQTFAPPITPGFSSSTRYNFDKPQIGGGGSGGLNLTDVLNAPRSLNAAADSTITVSDALWGAMVAGVGKEGPLSGTSFPIKTPGGTTIYTFTVDTTTATNNPGASRS